MQINQTKSEEFNARSQKLNEKIDLLNQINKGLKESL
jgi:hypothetical protein